MAVSSRRPQEVRGVLTTREGGSEIMQLVVVVYTRLSHNPRACLVRPRGRTLGEGVCVTGRRGHCPTVRRNSNAICTALQGVACCYTYLGVTDLSSAGPTNLLPLGYVR